MAAETGKKLIGYGEGWSEPRIDSDLGQANLVWARRSCTPPPFSVWSVRLSWSRKGRHRRAGAIMQPIDMISPPCSSGRPAGDLLASFQGR